MLEMSLVMVVMTCCCCQEFDQVEKLGVCVAELILGRGLIKMSYG